MGVPMERRTHRMSSPESSPDECRLTTRSKAAAFSLPACASVSRDTPTASVGVQGYAVEILAISRYARANSPLPARKLDVKNPVDWDQPWVRVAAHMPLAPARPVTPPPHLLGSRFMRWGAGCKKTIVPNPLSRDTPTAIPPPTCDIPTVSVRVGSWACGAGFTASVGVGCGMRGLKKNGAQDFWGKSLSQFPTPDP